MNSTLIAIFMLSLFKANSTMKIWNIKKDTIFLIAFNILE